MRKVLQLTIQNAGENHHASIKGSFALANALYKEGHEEEAMTTAKSALQRAKSTLGASHPVTAAIERFIRNFKYRHSYFIVDLISNDPRINGQYATIKGRAKHDEDKYIVSYLCDGKTTKVKARIDQLRLCENLSVTCHSLVNAAHLNGKTGRVKSYQEKVKRYEICFDDKSIKGCLVRPENLRINI